MNSLVEWLSQYPDRCDHGYHTVQRNLCADCQPEDADEWTVFLAAVRKAAHGGRVRQADVRPLIRGRVEPKHVGQMYRRARNAGILREVAHERSDDVAGRNAGRLEPVYELRSA